MRRQIAFGRKKNVRFETFCLLQAAVRRVPPPSPGNCPLSTHRHPTTPTYHNFERSFPNSTFEKQKARSARIRDTFERRGPPLSGGRLCGLFGLVFALIVFTFTILTSCQSPCDTLNQDIVLEAWTISNDTLSVDAFVPGSVQLNLLNSLFGSVPFYFAQYS